MVFTSNCLCGPFLSLFQCPHAQIFWVPSSIQISTPTLFHLYGLKRSLLSPSPTFYLWIKLSRSFSPIPETKIRMSYLDPRSSVMKYQNAISCFFAFAIRAYFPLREYPKIVYCWKLRKEIDPITKNNSWILICPRWMSSSAAWLRVLHWYNRVNDKCYNWKRPHPLWSFQELPTSPLRQASYSRAWNRINTVGC